MKLKIVKKVNGVDEVSIEFEGSLAEWASVRGDLDFKPKPSPGIKTLSRGITKAKRNARPTLKAQTKGAPEVGKPTPAVQVPEKTKRKTAKTYALGLSGAEFPPLRAKIMPKGVFGPITREQAALRSAKNGRRRKREKDKKRADAEAKGKVLAKTAEVTEAIAKVTKTVEVLELR